MLICLDVGNTHIVVGIYESEEKVSTYRISTNPNMTADELGIKILDSQEITPVSLSTLTAFLSIRGKSTPLIGTVADAG